MAITGHKSLSEVARYTRAADQQRLARQALSIQLRAEQNASEKLSNHPTRLDKTGSKIVVIKQQKVAGVDTARVISVGPAWSGSLHSISAVPQ
jgi:hypothetical protein